MTGFPQPLGRSFHVRSPQRARSPLRSGAQRVRSPLRPVNAAADATSPPPKPRTPPRPATPPPALFKASPPKVSTPKVSTPLAVRMPACAPIPPRTPSTPIDALRGIDVDDDACAADLLCEAVASHRKSVALSARRAAAPASPDEAWPAAEEPPSPPPPPLPESDDEEEPAAPVSVAVEALSAVAAESRGRLATALLALLNSASETELRDVLAGIGAVRARLIVETRSERLFESLDDAFGRIGLSAKQASNLTLANLRQILASRPTTSPRKRDGARARRSYRKSGRVLARKEGDDPKREYPATIVKVHDCGTVYDIKYDDGTTWKNAPAEVVRLR